MFTKEKRQELRDLATQKVQRLAEQYMLDEEDGSLPENVQATLERITDPMDLTDPMILARKAQEKMHIHCCRYGTAQRKPTLIAKAKKADNLADMLEKKGDLKGMARNRERARSLRARAELADA